MRNGRLTAFVIQTDGDRSVYSPGDFVDGHLELVVSKGVFKFSRLEIVLSGTANVENVSCSHGGITPDPKLLARNQYSICNIPQVIFRKGEENDLTTGRHKYRFSIRLPQIDHFPTSVEVKGNNYIRYQLKAELDSLAADDSALYASTLTIKLVNHISINKPQYLASVYRKIDSAASPVSGSVELDRSAYCVGESVQIVADFRNESNQVVVPSAALYQRVETALEDGQRQLTLEKVVGTDVFGEPLAARGQAVWTRKELIIPPTTPSILNSPLLSLNYLVRISVKSKRAKSNKELETLLDMPLVIGTLAINGEPSFHLQEFAPERGERSRILDTFRLLIFALIVISLAAVAYFYYRHEMSRV